MILCTRHDKERVHINKFGFSLVLIAVWLYVHSIDLEVRLLSFHGFDHCHSK